MNFKSDKFSGAIFISGIGTDVGKSYATGWLAKKIAETGKSVITQKLIQTGNKDMSEDIEVHRKIMGIPLQTVDICHITAPLILSYPASPHLAAKIDGVDVDFGVAAAATQELLKSYDTVLIEGAGGLMVPLKERFLTIDYISEHQLPVVLVSNGKLGSISDTLLALEALKARNIPLTALLYNPYFDADEVIASETKEYLEQYILEFYPDSQFIVM